MSRAPSHVRSFFRHRACCDPNSQLRNLTVESRDGEITGEETKSIGNGSVSSENCRGNYTEMVKLVSKIIRERPRWEQSLASDFPSFDFSDPLFFRELVKKETNVLMSLWFYQWLCSNHGFKPDPVSCNLLFKALLDSKAVRAAKSFLDDTGFNPEPPSLERYVMCLCEEGLIEEAIEVYFVLKEMGIHRPSIETCNSVLSGCLEARKTDLLLEFYQEMIESGTVADANVETVGFLIQAFCNNGQILKSYELLQQVLKEGLDPRSVAYNKVIAGFCQRRNYASMSEILHTMIARNHAPTIYTYQEIINGLCKNKKRLEAYRIFNDLKDRGYAPDRVMYTTTIHGLCEMGWLGDARKLWFEMINKGLRPNEFTYNAMLHGYLRARDFEQANKIYKEMCEKGYGETTVSCNTVISGFCLHGRSDEAFELFQKMSEKGIPRDAITYNSLIQGFCKEGKIDEGIKLLDELIGLNLKPSASSYTVLVEKLCECRDVEQAKRFCYDMSLRGLEPLAHTRELLISAFCAQGHFADAMDWLMGMLENKLKPKATTFEKMIQCLAQVGKFDDLLFVLDLMFRIGYTTKEGVYYSLVSTLCQNNSDSAGTSLSLILD